MQTFGLGNTERVVIEIDSETGDYRLEMEYVRLAALEGVLRDVLSRIEHGTLVREGGIEIVDEN